MPVSAVLFVFVPHRTAENYRMCDGSASLGKLIQGAWDDGWREIVHACYGQGKWVVVFRKQHQYVIVTRVEIHLNEMVYVVTDNSVGLHIINGARITTNSSSGLAPSGKIIRVCFIIAITI